MNNVVDFRRYRRARQGTQNNPRRAPNQPQGLVSIGVVSAELVRRLTEMD
jgi:hypothetical protein